MSINKNQKGVSNTLVVLLFIMVAVVVVLYLIQRQQPAYLPNPSLQVKQTPGIQNDADLMKSSTDLDSVNVDSLDSEMSQLDKDASGM